MAAIHIIIPIVVGVGLSITFAIYDLAGNHDVFTQQTDPRILQTSENFTVDSNLHVFSIQMDDEEPVIGILVGKNEDVDGFVIMDDPLPILQELFPDEGITSVDVMTADRTHLSHTLHEGKLRFDIKDVATSKTVLIRGR